MVDLPDNRDASDDVTLDEVFAELIRQSESGERIDEAAVLARYPLWREELLEFLAGRADLERFAAQLGGGAAMAVLPPGTRMRYVGDYELLEELGRGGMGYVYRARQVSLDRHVALKFFVDANYDRARFEAEVQAAAAIEHPHIVTVYETGEHEGRPYYTMQLIEGSDLRAVLETQSFDEHRAAACAVTLARAIQFAHDRGVLHRDLKPANVLLDAAGEPHITDFGLAKLVDEDNQLTRSGAVLGTPSYMAPEQAAGDIRNVTTLTDIHGLGTILYAMMTGKPPFTGATPASVLRRVEEDTPEPPRTIRPATSRDLETICLKCLEKLPTNRYASAREVADDLERFLSGEPIAARPVSVAERTWRWCRRNPLIATLLSVIGGLVVMTAIGGTTMAIRERLARQREAILHDQRATALYEAESNLIDFFTSSGREAQWAHRDAEAALWYALAAVRSRHQPERHETAWVRASVARRAAADPVYAAVLKDTRARSISFHPDGESLLVHTYGGGLLRCARVNEAAPESFGPFDDVTDAVWLPGGDRVVVSGDDGGLAVVDSTTEAVLATADMPETVRSLALSHDGTCLAAVSGSQLSIWEVARSLKLIDSADQPAAVLTVAFDRNGERLVTSCADGYARLFARSDKGLDPLFRPFPNATPEDVQSQPILRPMFVNQGQEIVTQPTLGKLVFTNVETGQPERELQVGRFRAIAIDAKGEQLVVGGPRSISLWGVPNGRLIRRMKRRDHTTELMFSSDARMVAAGGLDRQVVLRSVRWNTLRLQIQHHATIDAVALAPDGDCLATAQADGLVRMWHISTSRQPPRYSQTVGNAGSGVRISAGGDMWFATGRVGLEANASELQIRRLDNGMPVGNPLSVPGILRDADMSRDQHVVAAISSPGAEVDELAGGDVGTLSIWKWRETAEPGCVVKLPAAPLSLTMRPDGDTVAVYLGRGDVFVVRTTDGEIVRRLSCATSHLANSNAPAGPRIGSGQVRFSPNGERLLAWGDRNDLCVWDAKTPVAPHLSLGHPQPVRSVHFSSDGSLMATACADGGARVWDLASGRRLAAPIEHPDHLYAARFTPNADHLITACADDRVRMVNWRTGQVELDVNSHRNDVFDAMVTPDGRWLISAGDGGFVHVSDARDGLFVDRLVMAPGVPGQHAIARSATLHLSPNGRFLVVAGKRTSVVVGDLGHLYQQPSRSPEELFALSELAASKTIRGNGVVSLDADEWLDRWEAYKKSY